MSLSSSFPHGAPSLAEVLIQRTFAKPVHPFVDGEFLEALEKADDAPPAARAVAKPAKAGSDAPGSGAHGSVAGQGSAAGSSTTPGRTIDVRV
ncbi:MAG TPA: hypothetical protein VNT03_14485 [Baekduia sp.]|nr:hypothetical protein [Baekduia sp.]